MFIRYLLAHSILYFKNSSIQSKVLLTSFIKGFFSRLIFFKIILWILIPSPLYLASCNNSAPLQKQEINQDAGKNLKLKKFNFTMTTEWIDGPFDSINRKSHLRVTLTQKNGELVDLPQGTYLEFYATMPSMGHPYDQGGFFKATSLGVFDNKGIVFQMGGLWKMELLIMNESTHQVIDKVIWWNEF